MLAVQLAERGPFRGQEEHGAEGIRVLPEPVSYTHLDYGKPETTDSIMEHADGAFAGKPDIAAVPVASAGEPDDLSYHARSTRRKSNTAAEILPEGWYHAGVRPAEHVSLPDWLLDEPDKVAHRDYSTGFYYPEHKVQQSTDRSAYFRAWLVVGEVLSWSPEDGGRVTIMSRNKIEAGQEVEFVLPGAAPLAYTCLLYTSRCV